MLPGYVRSGSLPSQAWVIYNAKLTASTGTGAYVLHSGGGLSERIYDMVGDAEGNVYNVGCDWPPFEPLTRQSAQIR